MKPFSSKMYNVLKIVALIWLPAIAALYTGIATLWSIGHVAEVVGTITTVDTFLGALLGVSTASYNAKAPSDGSLVIDKTNPLKDTYSLEISTPLEDLENRTAITLRVRPSAYV